MRTATAQPSRSPALLGLRALMFAQWLCQLWVLHFPCFACNEHEPGGSYDPFANREFPCILTHFWSVQEDWAPHRVRLAHKQNNLAWKMLLYSAKYFPLGLVNIRGKQRKLMFARREIRSLPQYGAQLSNQSRTCSPARPETNTLLLFPCRNLLVWDTFHSLLSVLYFHSLQVLLEGWKPKSVIWVILALLLQNREGEAAHIPFSSQGGWCTIPRFFSWRGMQHTSGGAPTSSSEPDIPSVWRFPQGCCRLWWRVFELQTRRAWTSSAVWDSFSLIPLDLL